MEISDNALRVLNHTLGLSVSRTPFRNHFVAGLGHHDMPALEELERAGLMARGKTPSFCDPDDIVFLATDSGLGFAIEHLPPEPKRTKYEEWLDADTGHSFAEFLGIDRPEYESRWNGRSRNYEWRMYKPRRRRNFFDVEIHGEWAATKKAAKASYKAALKAKNNHRPEGGAERAMARRQAGGG